MDMLIYIKFVVKIKKTNMLNEIMNKLQNLKMDIINKIQTKYQRIKNFYDVHNNEITEYQKEYREINKHIIAKNERIS